MQSKSHVPIPLVVFMAAYVVIISVSAHGHENHMLTPYLLHLAVLVAIILAVHRRSNLSTLLLWCLCMWELLHMAGGLVRIPAFLQSDSSGGVLYSLVFVPDGIKYDQAVHAYGFGITTWMCWEVLRNGIQTRYGHRLTPTLSVVVLCGAAGMGFGALNEVVEFIAVLTLPDTNVGGFTNTGWDLIYNTLGAVLCASFIFYKARDQRLPSSAQ